MALRKIGALWRPKPGGKAALSGSLDFLGESVRIIVLKNEKKHGDRDPDFVLYRSIEDEPKPGAGDAPGRDGGDDL